MKKFITLFTVALALIVLGTSCQQITSVGLETKPDETSALFYFYDALTGQEIEFEDADVVQVYFGSKNVQTLTGKDSAIGKVNVGYSSVYLQNFVKEDKFSITVKKEGFYDYKAVSVFGGDKQINTSNLNNDGSSDSQVFVAALLPKEPEAIKYSTQELKFTVIDSKTKELVNSGTFVVKLTTNVKTGTFSTTGATNLGEYAMTGTLYGSSAYSFEGQIVDGIITIPSGTLFSDKNYTVTTEEVDGYKPKTTNFTSDGNDNEKFLIKLDPLKGSYEEPEERVDELSLIAVNNITSKKEEKKGVRTIELTFNKNIVVNKDGLRGLAFSDLVAFYTFNTDNDGDDTFMGQTATPSSTHAFAPGVAGAIVANGKTLSITIPSDVELTTGATETPGRLDTGDALRWKLDTLYSKLEVRVDNNDVATGWKNLTGIDSEVKDVDGKSISVSDTAFVLVRD